MWWDNSSCADACGVPNGDNSTCLDACGVPNGDSSSCADCAGTPNGNAYEDQCGTCDADASNDCVQDCAGEWGGTSIDDECGICGGDNSSCADCAGTPNGNAYEDQCGTCDADASNDCIQDCAGFWGGNAVIQSFYYDSDGDGLGYDDAVDFCNAFVPTGWVDNADDLEPTCPTNDTDACKVCGGDNSSCADCAGVPNGNAYEDMCGTCDADASNDCVQDC